MKGYYSKYISEYSWLIKEEGWVKSLQGLREAQLALGNGFIGSRAILEEIPYDTKPLTYISGLYDNVGSQVDELVNFPNPFNFKIAIDGEKLGMVAMEAIEHKRVLDLKHGLLLRHTVFEDAKKRRYDYQSLRFLSMHNKNVGVMQVIFTPQDNAVKASIQTGIDTSVYNAGTVTEGRKKHFRLKELGQFKNEGYLIVETFNKLHTVIIRSGFYYETKGRKVVAKDNIFELNLRKNQTVVFTKIFYIDAVSGQTGLDTITRLSEKRFRKVFQSEFDYLLKKHIKAWQDIWDVAEVSIWGDPELEKNFRFNIYHMLICAPRDHGLSSIGPKALTGQGYRGHVFWDTEIFLLPFYLYTFPEAAKNILLYRYRRLDAARANAEKNGFKGAMFPWESAGLGDEQTPGWAKDLDGSVIKIYTGKQEQHITADIAYAFYHYYNVTKDEGFLRGYVYEVLFETAKFWASRVEYNKRKKKYEIKHVIGPDEFHRDINNNAYTNIMAKWNLITGYKLFQKLKKSNDKIYKKIIEKTKISNKEAKEWQRLAACICINVNKGQVIEQFDGYFKKKRVRISNWDENYLPVFSKKIRPREYNKTQLVKQADVIMFLYLLSDVFNLQTKRRNYEYYIERTMHKSSLSLPSYALIAIDAGDKGRAYRFFHTALHTDISNIHGTTNDGIHAACMGGTWQVLIHGFAGVKIQREILSINPKLPRFWRKVLFSLHYSGQLLRLEVKNNRVKLRLVSPDKKKIKLKVFGVLRELSGSKVFNFKRKRPVKEPQPQVHYL